MSMMEKEEDIITIHFSLKYHNYQFFIDFEAKREHKFEAVSILKMKTHLVLYSCIAAIIKMEFKSVSKIWY